MINLGDRVKDGITGFEGIAVSITAHITGCDTIGVRPEKLHDGKIIDCHWFDVNRLEVIKELAFAPSQNHQEKPGGPRPIPHGVNG